MAAKAGAKHLTLAYPLVGPNIKRFAAHSGYQAAAREDGADYHLTLTKK